MGILPEKLYLNLTPEHFIINLTKFLYSLVRSCEELFLLDFEYVYTHLFWMYLYAWRVPNISRPKLFLRRPIQTMKKISFLKIISPALNTQIPASFA